MNQINRPIRIEGDLAYVPLTRGHEAVIDAADLPLVQGAAWHASDGALRSVYAQGRVPRGGKKVRVYMHRLIMGAAKEVQVDHVNKDTLDNRRTNLRAATKAQNMHNVGLNSRNSSGYKGVSWSKVSNKWQAHIRCNGERFALGLFTELEAAAAAYAKACAELHGEFGRLS